MLDPLTAFATAGTVLQVVDFGGKILHLAIQYAENGGTTETSAIESYVRNLLAANTELQETLLKAKEITAPGPGRALHLANLQCLAVSEELVQVMQSLKLDKMNWWRVARKAFHEHRSKPKLESLKARLDSARNNLTVCFLVYSDHKQNRLLWKSETMSETMCNINDAVSKSQGLEQHIDALGKELANISLIKEGHSLDIKAILASHSEDLQYIAHQLDKKIFSQTEKIDTLQEKLDALEHSVEHELRTRMLVIGSLAFPKMNDRKTSIQRAHRETYQWVFDPNGPKRHVWDNFVEWVTSGSSSPVYWIRGKPGSGKSTLLKQMADEIGHRPLEGDWLQGQQAIIASSFFWIGGTFKQRSLQGLLQSLLHQIFSARPDIVAPSVMKRRWHHCWHTGENALDWYNDELKVTLNDCVSHLDDSPLLLLIDGLDEFDGDDDERLGVIDLLYTLTTLGRVKICISSRPWNVFKDAFANCPQLKLEDLTFDDIQKFVHDSLTENDLFMRKLSQKPSMLNELTTNIAETAMGVFLWVRLVVRDLLKSLRDGCQVSSLKRVLDGIPRDLNEYFMAMMRQMDPAYRGDAARILQIKIQDLRHTSRVTGKSRESPSLRLFDLYHLQEDLESVHFVLASNCEIIDFASCEQGVIEEIFDTLERRLASRTMGLLEIFVQSRDKTGLLQAEIVYLHRTVKDFLCSPQAQKTLRSFNDQFFDTLGFWCNVLVARLMGPELSCYREPAYTVEEYKSWTECFLAWAQSPELDQGKTVALYAAASPSIAYSRDMYKDEMQMSLAQSWAEGKVERDDSLPLVLAVQAGWYDYIGSIPSSRLPRWWNGRSLLDIALRPCLQGASPHPAMTSLILGLDMDPNQRLKKSASEEDSSQSIWTEFVGSLVLATTPNRIAVVSTLEIMLRAGASLRIGANNIGACFKAPPYDCTLQLQSLDTDQEVHVVDLLDCTRQYLRQIAATEVLTVEDIEGLRSVCLELDPDDFPLLAPRNLQLQPSPTVLSPVYGYRRGKRKWSCAGSEDMSRVPTHKRRSMITTSASFSQGDTLGADNNSGEDQHVTSLARWDSVP